MIADSSYQPFAEKVLAHYNLDRNCVPAGDGCLNNVFLSKDAAVRMPRDVNYCYFPSERWAIERVREHGVPAPRVIAVDTSKSLVPVQYMLAERLPGYRAKDSTPAMCRELGEMLARIHSVKTAGYGRVDENGNGSRKDWVANINMDRRMLPELANTDHSLAIRAESVYDDLEKYPQPSCLVHGDFGLHNMLFSNEKLTGIFDFSGKSDSPYLDIGDVLRHAPHVIGQVEEGYGTRFDYHLALLYAAANSVRKLPFMHKMLPEIAGREQKRLDETLKKLGK